MMQGDSCSVAIEILNADGSAVTASDVTDVEVMIGSIRKTYSNKDVSFYGGKWVFPLTQKETLNLPPTYVDAQVRVAFVGGDVEGVSLGEIKVHESNSKAVL